MMQCYYQSDKEDLKTRCENQQEDCWCSEEHKNAWQEENYKGRTIRGTKRLTIGEMREQLKQMAIKAKLRAHTEKNGQLKIG